MSFTTCGESQNKSQTDDLPDTPEIDTQAELPQEASKSDVETTELGIQADMMHISDYYTDKGKEFQNYRIILSHKNHSNLRISTLVITKCL